jgi:hypothetical protein
MEHFTSILLLKLQGRDIAKRNYYCYHYYY